MKTLLAVLLVSMCGGGVLLAQTETALCGYSGKLSVQRINPDTTVFHLTRSGNPRDITVLQGGKVDFTTLAKYVGKDVTLSGRMLQPAQRGLAVDVINPAFKLNRPSGLANGYALSVLVSDTDNHRILKITRDGVVSTIAGDGVLGITMSGGLATAAHLSYPSDITFNPGSGDIYFSQDNRVWKIDASGKISTVAGTDYQSSGPTPGQFGGDGGPATNAKLFSPTGLAVDSAGDLYISDSGNRRIRKVNTSGIITTIAGNGTAGKGGDGGPAIRAQLGDPRGLAIDRNGNVYLADDYLQTIRKISSDGGIMTVAGVCNDAGFNGDGPALSTKLNYPRDIAVDNSGDVYVGDRLNHRIRRFIPGNSPSSGTVSTVAGDGSERGDFSRVAVERSGPLNLFLIGYTADNTSWLINWIRPDRTVTPIGKNVPECVD